MLSARKLQRANVQLKHRESQLRDAVFLVNWLKNKAVLHPDDSGETEAELRAGKLLHASSETLHHADEDSLVAAAAAAVDLDQPQPDYYEDEVRRLMSNLEKQVTPLLAEYDGEPDFESTTDAEEWRSKHHTGYVLLKHWKRRCLEAEATVHRLLRDQPQSVPVEMPIADFKAEEKEPRHVRHTAFIADMLNQTNRILSRDDDREVDLQNHIDLDRKSVKTVAKSSKQARPAAVLKSSPTKAKHNTGKHQRRITASPDNTSVDIDPTFWKQRFLARDIEFRDKARELNDCQHLLSKQFREVDQLRRER